MKASYEIEIFNYGESQKMKIWSGILDLVCDGLSDVVIGKEPSSGWVAKITGIDLKWGYKREFLKGKIDYSRANSNFSRGVFKEYILQSGFIYEIKQKISWKRTERFFCKVNEEGDVVRVPKEEVDKWLKNLSV